MVPDHVHREQGTREQGISPLNGRVASCALSQRTQAPIDTAPS